MADYSNFLAIGDNKSRSAAGVQYTPTSNEQVRTAWFRLARYSRIPANSQFYGSNGNVVNTLTVTVHPQTTNASGQEVPDTTITLGSTTIPWDSQPTRWPDGFHDTAVVFTTPVQLAANTDYWLVVDMGTTFPQYSCLWAFDSVKTSTDFNEWAAKWSDGIWYNNSSTWRTASWNFGLYFAVDTEGQARGPRFHVVVDGQGYMTPDNLSSAIESTAVPFSGKLGSGRQEWSDLEYPYSADSWDTWLGGIGTERADDRPNGYTIGTGIDTRTSGQLIVAPVPWETNVASSRPPRNFDIDHITWTFPMRDANVWYPKLATPVQMPASAVTIRSIRSAFARFFKGPWHTLKIRIETDNAGEPSGTAVQDDGANDLDFTIAEASMNPLMTWFDQSFTANWTTTGNEKVWVILQADSWPTAVTDGQPTVEPFLHFRATNDVLDTDEFSGSFYPSGYTPQVYDGTSWSAATFGGTTWAVQWNLLDDGVGAQAEDFVYWPSQDKLYACADDLWSWNEGANPWDGYWSAVAGASTGCDRAEVFNNKLYIAKGTSTQALESSDGSTFNGLVDDDSNAVNIGEMFVANGFIWVSTGANTVRKWNGVGGGWSSAITVGTSDYVITGFELFQGQVHVAKEDGIWYIDNNDLAFQRINYHDQVFQHNGKGILNFGELLYFNVGNAYWRWTGATTDFKGPYDGFGSVPQEWTGIVIDAISVGKHAYAALWASTTGTSQVLAFNGIGWHPIYAPFGTTGNKVRAVYWTEGDQAGASVSDGGRLWIAEASHIRYIELPDRTDNPVHWTGSAFDNYGWIELPWWDGGLREIDKFFRNVRVEVENFTEELQDNLTISIGCYINDGDDHDKFHLLGRFVGGQDIVASFPPDVQGKAVKILVGLEHRGVQTTPVVRSITLSALLRPPQTYVHSCQLLLGDDVRDMHGDRITRTANDMWDDLKADAESKIPIQVTFPWDGFDAFITSLSARTINYQEEGRKDEGLWEKIATVSFIEAKE